MKKTLITLCIALAACVSAWAGTPEKVEKLIRQYKGQEGFEVVTIGRLGLSLIKTAAKMDGDLDEQDRAALRALDGITKLVVAEFEDAPSAQKAQFTAKLEKLLSGMELVLETRDETETFRIYGIEDGKRIRDCILYSSDGAVMYVAGSIDLDSAGALMGMEQ